MPIGQFGRSLPLKLFTGEPDTGMSCALMRYDAGFINPSHTHRCAHGMFVLSGTLRTHEGDFGPGSFVWFPEGMTMYHGATEDSDCLMLFITNKPFNIRYTFEDEPSGSEAERLGREKRACVDGFRNLTRPVDSARPSPLGPKPLPAGQHSNAVPSTILGRYRSMRRDCLARRHRRPPVTSAGPATAQTTVLRHVLA